MNAATKLPPEKVGAEFLAELRTEIERHPAVNHLFLQRCATSPFSKQDYRIFAENHLPMVCVFTSYLEALLVRGPTSESKMWFAKVLVDEYGEGSEGHDHATLYGEFLRACGGDPDAVRAEAVRQPAYEFITTHRHIVRERSFLEGLGAIGPGHEWAIPKMFDAVIPGLKRAGLTPKEMHYFTLHVEQDMDHGAWLEEALKKFATTPENCALIRAGALASLEARGKFWDGVQKAVVRYRQPISLRPDGSKVRSDFKEVGLAALDGNQVAWWVRGLIDKRSAAKIPTLTELIEQGRTLGRI